MVGFQSKHIVTAYTIPTKIDGFDESAQPPNRPPLTRWVGRYMNATKARNNIPAQNTRAKQGITNEVMLLWPKESQKSAYVL